jgi:hypothetical protein
VTKVPSLPSLCPWPPEAPPADTEPLDEVVAGDLLLVAAGDVVPVDGALAADAAVLDESGCTRCRKTRRTCRSTTTRKP